MSTITPAPLTITRDGDTLTVRGSAADLALLRSIGELKTDRIALGHIQNVFGCDRDTARVLLAAAREGQEDKDG